MSLIPEEYHDLVADDSKAIAYLATTLVSGAPVIAPVWFAYQNNHILIVTERLSLKVKNMMAHPQVSITLQDPENQYRYIQIRGQYIASYPDDDNLLNELSKRYIGKDYPNDGALDNLVLKIRPEKVNVFTWEYE